MATIAEGLLTLFRDLLAAREDARVREFVGTLDIGDDAKSRLLALTPAGYTGLADDLVDGLG